jgi:uncharacterized membrane protein
MLLAFDQLLLAGAVFVGGHVLISSTQLRGQLRDGLGEAGYLALYSALALVSFAWFVFAFLHAPHVVIWRPPVWTRWIPLLVMPVAAILVIGGLTTSNPTSVGMERKARLDDPAPGLLRVTRHPLMWGLGLWALAHLAANGDLAAILFFGSLAALALGGTRLIDRRKRLALGTDWARLAEVTSNLPFAALLARRTRLPWREIGLLRPVAGLLLYAVLLLAHPLYAGVAVLMR